MSQTLSRVLLFAAILVVFPICSLTEFAKAAPVDLSTWLVDGAGNWILQSDVQPNDSVLQTLNSRPTMFFNNQNSQGTSLSGSITVQTTNDDDFIGFVLGYDDEDLFGTNAPTDYILVDWKQGTQAGWDAGMSISRVIGSIDAGGTDTGADAWQHTGNVSFIERAATLGNVGWADNTEYLFDVVFTSTNIRVSIDGVEQFNINGTFEDGSFGFYNFSQPNVRYAGITGGESPEVDDDFLTAFQGETIDYTFTGSDPDDDPLTWELVDFSNGSAPAIDPSFDPDTQRFLWDTTGSDPGIWTATVRATDPDMLFDEGVLTIELLVPEPFGMVLQFIGLFGFVVGGLRIRTRST